MKVALFLAVLTTAPVFVSAQYIPPDTYFSGGGPAYSPAPRADNVTTPAPSALTTAAYQWWAHNLPGSSGPRNAVPARPELGDLPALPFEMADLRLPRAWSITTPAGGRVSGRGVSVAIIDDGIASHPDFEAGTEGIPALDPEGVHHRNFYNGASSPEPVSASTDTFGTALAGIVGARQGAGTAGQGLAGVAPLCTLQGLVAFKATLHEFYWAEAFDHGTSLTDTDGDSSFLDEQRTGQPFADICLNTGRNSVPAEASNLYPETTLWHRAVRHGATSGRNSKGVIYITPAGDGADGHWNTNYDEQKNSIFQIPVTGVSDMGRRIGSATVGANIVCAGLTRGDELAPALQWFSRPAGFPSSRPLNKTAPIEPDDLPAAFRRRSQGISVLTNPSAVNFNFSGTSAAAAQVAGIVALMLELRPDLTARDVKEILLRSGRVVNDARYDNFNAPLPYEPNGAGSAPQQTYPWPASGPHPPPTLAEGPTQWRMSRLGRPLHHALGAGLIDAYKALKIAQRWRLLPPNPFPAITQSDLSGGSIGRRNKETGGIYLPVVANNLIPTSGSAAEVIVPPPPAGMRLEHVEVRVIFYHQRRGDLEIKLVAPGEASWGRDNRPLVSHLYVPHREDYTESPWDSSSPELRNPTDWTFSTLRHWGTVPAGSPGLWKVVIRDAVTKGATNSATTDDPVICPADNPTDITTQRLAGVAITYHGAMETSSSSETAPWDPPVITTGRIEVGPATEVVSQKLDTVPPGAGPDGETAFPVTSWDFFNLPDIVPVHAAAPAKSPFLYFPPGVSINGAAPVTARFPTITSWPATPAWIPLTTPPAVPPNEPAGAVVGRPRWAEFSDDGRFLVLRDPGNFDPETNFIFVRLNRALGVLDIIPWRTGVFNVHVIAENLVGISQPQRLVIEVRNSPASYAAWSAGHFFPEQLADPEIGGPNADPDHDGFSNVLEQALTGDPWQQSPKIAPVVSVTTQGDSRYPALTFTRRAGEASPPIAVQFSNDLLGWDLPAVLENSIDNGDGSVTESWHSAAPAVAGQRIFGRLKVTVVP